VRILVLGAKGMLGDALIEHFLRETDYELIGTARANAAGVPLTAAHKQERFELVDGVSIEDEIGFDELLDRVQPAVVINCIGLRGTPQNPIEAAEMIRVNSVWPHRLASWTSRHGVRLIHVSSDAVFSGLKGQYSEEDIPDPVDVYGRSKLLGEPKAPMCLTLRTSMIGHASVESDQLLDWLLRQTGSIQGFRNAVFSGLPTVEIARIIRRYVLPNSEMEGVWHLAAAPISKFDLLTVIADRYALDLAIKPVDEPVIDRSLDASKFATETSYIAEPWPKLIEELYWSLELQSRKSKHGNRVDV
jgi:dTDP-4-dehydrorhamnose reductase